MPQGITISDAEVREALAECVDTIVGAVRATLERVPPELSGDLVDRGIMLVGGGSLLRNLDKKLSAETELPVFLAENSQSAVVLGTGKLLSDFPLLKKVSLEVY